MPSISSSVETASSATGAAGDIAGSELSPTVKILLISICGFLAFGAIVYGIVKWSASQNKGVYDEKHHNASLYDTLKQNQTERDSRYHMARMLEESGGGYHAAQREPVELDSSEIRRSSERSRRVSETPSIMSPSAQRHSRRGSRQGLLAAVEDSSNQPSPPTMVDLQRPSPAWRAPDEREDRRRPSDFRSS